jgi:hypothetical protein
MNDILDTLTPEEIEVRLSPEFCDVMHKHIDACKKYGASSEQAKELLTHALLIAPPAFLEDLEKMVNEMNLIPEPSGYLEDGTPMVSLEDLARHLNIPPEKAVASMEKLLAKRAELGMQTDGLVVQSDQIHRRQ